jgi:hypothetical protein
VAVLGDRAAIECLSLRIWIGLGDSLVARPKLLLEGQAAIGHVTAQELAFVE